MNYKNSENNRKEKEIMFFNLLASETTSGSSSSTPASGSGWMSWVLIIGLVLVLVVFFVLSSRSNKKRQKETQQMLDAIQPGNKVKTIGGICGIVVEVNPDENTFVLETGTEASGKSYLKFDKQAIYQTDAAAKKTEKAELPEENLLKMRAVWARQGRFLLGNVLF